MLNLKSPKPMKHFELPEITDDITVTSYADLQYHSKNGDFVFEDGVMQSPKDLDLLLGEGIVNVHISDAGGFKIYQIVDNHTMQLSQLRLLLRESLMRNSCAVPETEQDVAWQKEGVDLLSDFIVRSFKACGIGQRKHTTPKDLPF